MLLQDLVEPSVVEVDVLLQVEERIADLLCFHLKGAQCCTLLTTSHGYVDVFLQLVQQLLGLPHVLGSEAANLLDVPVECLEEVLLRDVLRAELPRDLRAAHDRERGMYVCDAPFTSGMPSSALFKTFTIALSLAYSKYMLSHPGLTFASSTSRTSSPPACSNQRSERSGGDAKGRSLRDPVRAGAGRGRGGGNRGRDFLGSTERPVREANRVSRRPAGSLA
eukprot:CAMPEP_0198237066 /NCGR_PEP_ID=MMETSP1446-20131203/2912_1 /TAXON_ID=1461542 ORGANISM="Unidentified sp, Strain CCMP2111" /NCGR_SAMPLE_ID=MMETSP1446 /ASSEMBLY_ACC=CAM_ASM_001112 /LENGTH=221 /DNA_ID=CAMNT_0043919069 /DNA_START=1773 /DNA_END=2436 /DNA_ORIENTATION=-